MYKIGFCFLSHAAHVRHQLPIAVELAKREDMSVTLLYTTDVVRDEIEYVLNMLEAPALEMVKLEGSVLKTFVGKLKNRSYPNTRNVLKKNADYLLTYDCLVTPHSNLNDMMEFDKNRKLKYVCTFHGAGDGEIGFSKKFKDYDLLLSPGQEVTERLKAEGIKHEANHVVTSGYVKLETIEQNPQPVFENNNPTVLYTPHYERHLTSWYDCGEQVMDWFVNNPHYNLLLAPHIKLFERGSAGTLDKYRNYPNIFIDEGSSNLVNGTYTQVADIYLGDVSSQVYEFLYLKQRPARLIFINNHGVNWEQCPSYAMWHMGRVIEEIDEIEHELPKALSENISEFKTIQEERVKLKFLEDGGRASEQGAVAIEKLLKVASRPGVNLNNPINSGT